MQASLCRTAFTSTSLASPSDEALRRDDGPHAGYLTISAWNHPAAEWLTVPQAAASTPSAAAGIAAGKLPASRFGVRLIRVRAENADPLYRHIPSS